MYIYLQNFKNILTSRVVLCIIFVRVLFFHNSSSILLVARLVLVFTVLRCVIPVVLGQSYNVLCIYLRIYIICCI